MLAFAILTGLVSSVLCDSTVAPPTACVTNGHTYHVGESYSPNPCEHCYCTPSGQPACAIADCFFTPCVDAKHDPTKCCPVCPNGENCRAPDGTIIVKGDTYSPKAGVVCECPVNTFGFRGNEAICAVQATVAVAPHVVN